MDMMHIIEDIQIQYSLKIQSAEKCVMQVISLVSVFFSVG
jgi:hypothetical protein